MKRSTWDISFIFFQKYIHFVTFSQYRKNAAEENLMFKFPQLVFSGVKYNWNKKCLLHTVIIHATWTWFCMHSLWSCIAKCLWVLCHLFLCFDQKFKEISNAISPSSSDISTAVETATQKAVYNPGRVITLTFINSITKHSTIVWLRHWKSAATPFKPVTTIRHVLWCEL